MSAIGAIGSVQTRFGHGNSNRHKNLIRSDWEREYKRLKQNKPNDPRVQGVSLEQFIAAKEAAQGGRNGKK